MPVVVLDPDGRGAKRYLNPGLDLPDLQSIHPAKKPSPYGGISSFLQRVLLLMILINAGVLAVLVVSNFMSGSLRDIPPQSLVEEPFPSLVVSLIITSVAFSLIAIIRYLVYKRRLYIWNLAVQQLFTPLKDHLVPLPRWIVKGPPGSIRDDEQTIYRGLINARDTIEAAWIRAQQRCGGEEQLSEALAIVADYFALPQPTATGRIMHDAQDLKDPRVLQLATEYQDAANAKRWARKAALDAIVDLELAVLLTEARSREIVVAKLAQATLDGRGSRDE